MTNVLFLDLLMWVCVFVAGFFSCIWAIQNAWRKDSNVNPTVVWYRLADTTNGKMWGFIIWTLPRVLRWGSIVMLVASLVYFYSFGYGRGVFSAILPQLLFLEVATFLGTMVHIGYWWNTAIEGAASKGIELNKTWLFFRIVSRM